MDCYRITVEHLNELRACPSQLGLFAFLYPEGVVVTHALIGKLWDFNCELDVSWVLETLCGENIIEEHGTRKENRDFTTACEVWHNSADTRQDICEPAHQRYKDKKISRDRYYDIVAKAEAAEMRKDKKACARAWRILARVMNRRDKSK